jgi:hypothetical protein
VTAANAAGTSAAVTFSITIGTTPPAQVSLTPQTITSLWYDPAYEGSGFNMVVTSAGLVVYYYGWDKSGERLWLMSAIGPTAITSGVPVTLDMNRTNGGTWANPAKPATFASWGSVTFTFAADGTTANAVLAGADGVVNLDLTKLVPMANTASVSGLWYDPALEGSGFNGVRTTAGLIFYYYGWDADGNRLWLMSDLYVPAVTLNSVVTLPMRETVDGTFLKPASSSTLKLWGNVQFTFTSCTAGTARLFGNDGSTAIMNDLRLLVGVRNMPGC